MRRKGEGTKEAPASFVIFGVRPPTCPVGSGQIERGPTTACFPEPIALESSLDH